MINDKLIFAAIIVLMIVAITYLIYEYRIPKFIAYASGPEWDCDEGFIDIPGACECWHDGYTASVFNESRNNECVDKGNQYYAGFTAADTGYAQQEEDLNNQFQGLFNNITAKTLLNYTLVPHENQSITLYAFLPNAAIGPDGLPDTMRLIVGYSNSNALVGPNGVEEVLMKLAKSSFPNEIKEQLRNK
jgi:hypothetical protein